MRKFWMLALVAAFGTAACDTAPETADADDAMEESMDEMADDMADAMMTPALGEYTLTMMEGGNPDSPIGEEDVGMLTVDETTWSFAVNGEAMSNGTYVVADGQNTVTYETGDCAGHTSVFDITVSENAFSHDLVESTCEFATTHTEWVMDGSAMGDDHGAMDEGEMEEGSGEM